MAGIFGRIKEKFSKTSAQLEKYQEAITFAEAGETEYAMAAVAEEREEQEPNKLLVVGRESTLSCETFKLFSSSRDQVCEEFKVMSEKNAAMFQKAAAEKGILFNHVVMFKDPDEALQEVTRDNKNIIFVVSESIEDRADSRIEEGERLRQNLFVYSVV